MQQKGQKLDWDRLRRESAEVAHIKMATVTQDSRLNKAEAPLSPSGEIRGSWKRLVKYIFILLFVHSLRSLFTEGIKSHC